MSRMIKRRDFMRKTKKKLFKRMLTGVLAATLCVGGVAMAAPQNCTDYINDIGGAYNYESDDPLYAATRFHIFAKESASTQTHCNGNMATPLFKQNSNSGSRQPYGEEITYIGQLVSGSGADFGQNTKVVFGTETSVYIRNNTEILVSTQGGSEKKTESKKENVYTESADVKFIDFDKEFKKLTRLSVNLPKEASSSTITLNNNIINLSDADTDKTHYINVTPDQFMDRAFIIEGTDFRSGQALVINVNLGTATNYTIPFHQVLLKDKELGDFGTGEDKGVFTGLGNVLWNFYGEDAQGNIIPYSGTLKTCSEFKGSILAPNAVIETANSNQDGNFIGRVVNLGGGETHRWDFGGKLPKYDYGSLKVVVKNDESAGVADTIIEIYDENNTLKATFTTGADGSTDALDGLELGKNYTVKVDGVPYGYLAQGEVQDSVQTDYTKTKDITTADPDVVEIVLKDKEGAYPALTGYLQVIVKEKNTGKLVADAGVSIKNELGTSVDTTSPTTNSNGIVESKPISLPEETQKVDGYEITVTAPAGYTISEDTKTVSLTAANPDKVVFEVEKTSVAKNGEIIVKVVEEDGTTTVLNCVAQIIDKYGIIKQVTTTREDESPSAEHIAVQDDYTVKLISIPKGYEAITAEEVEDIELTESNPTYTHTFVLKKTAGSLDAIIKEEGTGNVIPGAKVEVTKVGSTTAISTQTTDSSGMIDDVTGLEEGKYIVHVVSVPNGFAAPKDIEVEITGTEKKTAEFVVAKAAEQGVLEVTIIDPELNKNIEGAKVNIVDAANNTIVKEGIITGATGSTGAISVPYGKYNVVTVSVPDGYTAPAPKKNIEINSPDKVTVPLTVVLPKGLLEVTIRDPKLDIPIEGAKVNIVDATDANNIIKKEILTGANGSIGTLSVPYGKYNVVTVSVPNGYTAPAPVKNVEIKSAELVTVPLEVEKEESDTPTTSVPTPTPTPTPSGETGAIKVTITDKNDPTKPIPDATVVIKDKTGTVIETVKTDKNGTTPVVDELKKGDTYTIETTVVPSGYTAPAPTTQKIESAETIEVKLEVGRDSGIVSSTGSLFVLITDKNTGAPVPNAQVQITNSANKVVKDVKTDSEGTITVGGLKPDTYTITTVSVPSGYTAPDPEKAEVIANGRTDTHLYVALSASTGAGTGTTSNTNTNTNTDGNVKTGDSSNAPLVGGIGIVAIVGIVVMSLKKRKMDA